MLRVRVCMYVAVYVCPMYAHCRIAELCAAPPGFFIRPEKRMNVGRDDKRRVHVEYMNTRAAVYTFRSLSLSIRILQLAYAGVLGNHLREGGHPGVEDPVASRSAVSRRTRSSTTRRSRGNRRGYRGFSRGLHFLLTPLPRRRFIRTLSVSQRARKRLSHVDSIEDNATTRLECARVNCALFSPTPSTVHFYAPIRKHALSVK